ncbi:unnamed protein product [Dovyalis caffra]|uniref:K Homology domain-containing protein n=1 Tax=Dovyalis caffra TaxID=77055 RepID=A0AAV1RVS0_9ROSI|nr:unnamed protein product [Dovyalis caffra]
MEQQQHDHQDPYHFQKQSHKRRPRKPLIELQTGQVAFRVVCHDSIIGGLIGHSGSIISQIRLETGCLVHCEEAVQGSKHWVIVVVGSASPVRKIAVGEGEEEVSGAQEAVVRVLERMWEVDAKKCGGGGAEREGYCGLLANTTQIGAVVGREGRNIKRIKRGSGAHIWILPAPPCACEEEQLIQITGSSVAVKKAVIDVSSRLQDCPPYEKDEEEMGFTVGPVWRSSDCSSSDPHAEFFPHLYSLLPTFPENVSSPTDGDHEKPPNQQLQVSFRMLCSHGAAGSIIGKGGSIVRALENETGASIVIAPYITNSYYQRVVTVSALESLESCHSPAQNALVLVFAKSIEHHIEKCSSSALVQGTLVTATLLLPSNVVCCLSREGDEVDSEIIENTGADIHILQGEQFFNCASENDVLVQYAYEQFYAPLPSRAIKTSSHITGEYQNVQNALVQVTSKLRDNLLPIEMLNELRSGSLDRRPREITFPRLHESAGESLDSNRETSLEKRVDQVCNPPSSLLQLPQVGGRSTGGGVVETTFRKSRDYVPKANLTPGNESRFRFHMLYNGVLRLCSGAAMDIRLLRDPLKALFGGKMAGAGNGAVAGEILPYWYHACIEFSLFLWKLKRSMWPTVPTFTLEQTDESFEYAGEQVENSTGFSYTYGCDSKAENEKGHMHKLSLANGYEEEATDNILKDKGRWEVGLASTG